MHFQKVYSALAAIVFSTFFCTTLAKCLWNVTCPCGSSVTPFQFCLDTAPPANPCATWKNCATCQPDLNGCLTCPQGLSGFKCSLKATNLRSLHHKKQHYNTDPCVVEGYGKCGYLKCPRSGSMKCLTSASINSTITECLATCFSGHTFQGHQFKREILLTCDEISWTPVPYFPDCIYDGQCDLQLKGNNSFNCTTTPKGKVCDIECYPPLQSSPQRYVCYPESGWTPPLPACIQGRRHRRKRITNDDSDGEQVECRDPGQVNNANRLVPGETRRSRPDYFNEKSFLIFYCDDGFVLHGASAITCLSSGIWSAPLPSCIPLRELTSRRPTECNDPGQVENANRLLFTAIRTLNRAQTFLPGESIVFSCNTGYTMVKGTSDLFCLDSGTWSASLPSCQRNDNITSEDDNANSDYFPDPDEEGRIWCYSLGSFAHGKITVAFSPIEFDLSGNLENEEFPDRTRIAFSCNEGYVLEGYQMLHCEQTGDWNSDKPKCIRDCGRSLPQTRKKVHFGVKPEPGEWPWVVAIANLSAGFPLLSCGGSLIDSLTVLTAAHCLIDSEVEKTSNIRLYFGKFHRDFEKDNNDVVIRMPSKFIIHPLYDPNTLDNDIALIQFEQPVTLTEFIQPVCLPTRETSEENLKPEKSGYVLGWGYNENNLPSDVLMMAYIPVVPRSECHNSYRRQNLIKTITKNMFCAGFKAGRASACTGDSGGPLVFRNAKTDRFIIEGIVSFGVRNQCGASQRYTVFTLVSNYVDWIQRSLN